nr:hypothetical protein BaRGS_022175 [Batillaria attramentaria]
MSTRIPINKDGFGLEDRQKQIWEDMETDMERRRREWEDEIEKMRREFFMLRPEAEERAGSGGGGSTLPLGVTSPRSRLLETVAADDSRGMVVKDDKGNPVFKVLFDVHDYRPEEVAVKMDANKIMVSARHEATQGGSSVSREYSREVKIPNDLDPMTLQCTMGPDGILTVEAPLPVPKYSAIKDSTALPVSLLTVTPVRGPHRVIPKSVHPFQTFSNQQTPSNFSPPIKHGSGGRIGSPVVSHDGKFKMEIDIEDFKPEELTVKTQDRKVVVCARREEKTGNRTSTRELSREHTLPDTVDPLTIKAFFTDGGKLIVEAPYRDAAPSQITGR